jgi:hypothetical protein
LLLYLPRLGIKEVVRTNEQHLSRFLVAILRSKLAPPHPSA